MEEVLRMNKFLERYWGEGVKLVRLDDGLDVAGDKGGRMLRMTPRLHARIFLYSISQQISSKHTISNMLC